VYNLHNMKIDQNIKVAVDSIIFGYQKNQLFVLLIKQKYGKLKDKWALPGGFVNDNEQLINAAKRELKEETGITVKKLEQLYTFGDDIKRDPRLRVISVAYFGTVNPKQLTLKAGTDAKEVQWFEIDTLPNLAFDHEKIIHKAFERLKAKLNYHPIGFDLLEKKFPFSDLENLYTTILEKPIDRRNFRKKILSFGFLVETNEMKKTGSGRPAKLYQFKKTRYNELLKQGISFEIKFA